MCIEAVYRPQGIVTNAKKCTVVEKKHCKVDRTENSVKGCKGLKQCTDENTWFRVFPLNVVSAEEAN